MQRTLSLALARVQGGQRLVDGLSLDQELHNLLELLSVGLGVAVHLGAHDGDDRLIAARDPRHRGLVLQKQFKRFDGQFESGVVDRLESGVIYE